MRLARRTETRRERVRRLVEDARHLSDTRLHDKLANINDAVLRSCHLARDADDSEQRVLQHLFVRNDAGRTCDKECAAEVKMAENQALEDRSEDRFSQPAAVKLLEQGDILADEGLSSIPLELAVK